MHIMCRLLKDKVIIKDNSYHCVHLENKTLNRYYKKVALEINIWIQHSKIQINREIWNYLKKKTIL